MNYVTNANIKRKKQIIYVMGGKCQLCGYDKCISALELHHLNPVEKEFNFAKQKNKAWEDLQGELKKCILVCSNCHREIHFEKSCKILESSYNKERAEKISKEIFDIKHRKLFYCKNCGKLISRGSQYCPECYHILTRKVERPSREELKYLIREMPFTTIGKQFNVSDNAIRKWCLKYNLPNKKRDIEKYTDEEWLKI